MIAPIVWIAAILLLSTPGYARKNLSPVPHTEELFNLLLSRTTEIQVLGEPLSRRGGDEDDEDDADDEDEDDGNGNGSTVVNPNASPPTPYVPEILYLVPGTTMDIHVLGEADPREGFIDRRGNKVINAVFSAPGITVNSITVNSHTSLTLNLSVAADTAPAASTVTIINPNQDSASSTGPVVEIIELPEIISADIVPTPPSVIDDIEVTVLEVQGGTPGDDIDFEYEWYEDEVLLEQTGPRLPATITRPGRSYRAVIKPFKNPRGNNPLRGKPFSTIATVVTVDKDENGIHDKWEAEFLDGIGNDPQGDHDKDGCSNRFEHFFGLDPKDARSSNPIVQPLCKTGCNFKFRRPKDRIPGIIYRIQTSPNLVNWTDRTSYIERLDSIDDLGETVEIEFERTLMEVNPKLFVRVIAE